MPSLFELCKAGSLEDVLKQLLLGADPNTKDNGLTPLHAASCFGHIHVVQLLLLYGADPKETSPYTGRLPIDIAREYEEISIIKLFKLYELFGSDVCLMPEEEIVEAFYQITSVLATINKEENSDSDEIQTEPNNLSSSLAIH